jgi:DNA-binding response OmpR family regulator
MAKEIRGRATVIKGAQLATPSVVVVDADPATGHVVAALLRAWGCAAVVTSSDDDAREVVVATRPSLVLVDGAFAGDGTGAAGRLRDVHPAARYVVATTPGRTPASVAGVEHVVRDERFPCWLASSVGR